MTIATEVARASQLLIDRANTAAKNLMTPVYNVVGYEADPTGVKDSTFAFQAAFNDLPTGIFGGGTVFVPPGKYLVKGTIRVPSGCRLVGAGPQVSRLVAGVAGLNVITVDGARRAAIADLMIDGVQLANTTGILFAGEASQISVRNVWLDSLTKAVSSTFVYFLTFDTVRVGGCQTAFYLGAASNAVTLTNTSIMSAVGGAGLDWFNSSGLTVTGCMFEGFSPIHVHNCQGVAFVGNYIENMGGKVGTWLEIGNAVGGLAEGITVTGNCFNNGADYAVAIHGANGVHVDGNYFRVDVAGIYFNQYDITPKHGVHIGNNSYIIAGVYNPAKAVVAAGPVFDGLNCNLNADVVQPQLLYPNLEPQPSTIPNGSAVLWYDVAGVLKVIAKDGAGVIKRATIATPV